MGSVYRSTEQIQIPSANELRLSARRRSNPSATNDFPPDLSSRGLDAKPHPITAADQTAAHNSRIDTDVALIVLNRGAQDAWISG